jgi:hypothetical protein
MCEKRMEFEVSMSSMMFGLSCDEVELKNGASETSVRAACATPMHGDQ